MDRKTSRSDRFLRLVADSDSIVILLESDATAEEFATAWAIGHLVECSLGVSWAIQGFSPERDGLTGAIAAVSRGWLDLASERLPGSAPLFVALRRGAARRAQLSSMWPIATLAVGGYSGANYHRSSSEYWDVRPSAYSVAALVANYIREQRVDIDAALASTLQMVIDRALVGGDGSPLESVSRNWLSRLADEKTIERLKTPGYGSERLSLLERCFGGLQENMGIAVAGINAEVDLEFSDDVAALATAVPTIGAALVVGPSDGGTAFLARSRPPAMPDIAAFDLLKAALSIVGAVDASLWGNRRRATGYSPRRYADVMPCLRSWHSRMGDAELVEIREQTSDRGPKDDVRPIR